MSSALRKSVRVLAICGFALGALAAYGDGARAAELVKYKIVDNISIPQSLTGKSGDPVAGRKVAINRKQGNCLGCHVMPIPEQAFHGEVGPDLAGVGSRYTEGQLRLRVVDPTLVNPKTIMPAFYRNTGFHRVMKKFKGKSVLNAEQVEDVVAYLKTLKY